MEIDQLRQFLVVARLGNISHAAEELALSQPTLSRSIKRLEEEFGQPLFERKTRSVELTEAGQLLHGRAETVLRLLDDAKAQIADDGRTGRVRIGAIPTIAPYFLPNFLRTLHREFKQAELVVQEQTTEELLARVKQGEVDLAILALPISAKYVEVEKLFEEELFLVTPKGHPLAERKRVTLDDVEPYPMVMLGEAHCLSDSVLSYCRQRAFQPVAVEQTSQLTTVQELVSLGHGISILPEMARQRDSAKTRVYRSFDGKKPTRQVAMAWNPYRFESKLQAAVKERLREWGTE